MKHLIITTLFESDENSNKIIDSFTEKINDIEVFHSSKYKIGNCIGCTNCWLKTPGICAVKDDWELLFRKILSSDCIIFITETNLGFVSYKMKNIVDRLIPLALPYTKPYKGELRHISRYNKHWKFGLIYSGNGNKEYLNEWMKRFTLNFFSKSLGAYKMDESEELRHEISNV